LAVSVFVTTTTATTTGVLHRIRAYNNPSTSRRAAADATEAHRSTLICSTTATASEVDRAERVITNPQTGGHRVVNPRDSRSCAAIAGSVIASGVSRLTGSACTAAATTAPVG